MLPSDITVITVTDTYSDMAGNPVGGSVSFVPTSQLTDATDNVVFPLSPVVVGVSKSTGTFTVKLPCTDNAGLTPGPWAYVVEISVQGMDPTPFTVLFPSALGASVQLRTVAPAVPPVPPVNTAVYSVNGQSGAVDITASQVGALPLAGGTMTGQLTLTGPTPLQIPAGAAAGDVFASDASGNGSWVTLTSLGAVSAAGLTAETSRAETAEALLAPKASPALTGTPTAPTATALTDSTQVATTAYADTAVGVETTRATAAEALKAPLASPALTGTPTAPTKTALTSNTDIATTAYADAAVAVETSRAGTAEALKAPLASPALTGTPTAPTQTTGDTSTKIATDAFVATAAAAAQAAAIAASLPTLTANVSVSASGTLATDTVTEVSAGSNLTMTLPSSVAGALIVVEKSDSSTNTVGITGSIRGVGSTTLTLKLQNESTMFLGYAGSWWPVAGHKTLGSLDSRYNQRPASTEAVYYVSAASYASDSNDGLSQGSAFATVQHAVSALPAGGGRILLGAGTYSTSSQISLNGLINVIIQGNASRTGGASAGSQLSYTGTASAFITAQSSAGCQLRDLEIIYTSSSFAGNLVDARNTSGSDTAFFRMDNCLLTGSSGISTAAALVALDKCITSEIVNCAFENAVTAITGRASSSYSNSIRVAGNHFKQTTNAAITSSGQAWVIEANTFEPLISGAAGAYTYGSGQGGNGVTFAGNWMGDVTSGGTWITWSGNNLVVRGNYIGGDASTTGVAVTSGSCFGIEIASNDFEVLNKAVDLGSTTGHTNFAVMFNTYTSVTTTVSATTWPTGGIHYNASSMRVGNFQMTGQVSGSGHGVILDAETGSDTAASYRGGQGLYVTSTGTEKLRLDAGVTLQHAGTSITTTTSLPALIPGVILAKNAITLTLGTPSNGFRSFIKNTDSANSVTLTASSGKIDNSTSIVVPPLQSVEIVADGVNWWIAASAAFAQTPTTGQTYALARNYAMP